MYYHQNNTYSFTWNEPEKIEQYSNVVINFLFNWQTLLAAIIAGVPAALGALYLWNQIKLQKSEMDRIKRKETISARVKLSSALASLTTYWKQCFLEIIDGNYSVNTPPTEALATLMDAASTVDENTFETFRSIITEAQIFSSRYRSDVGAIKPTKQDTLLLNIASLHAKTDSLYPYARFEIDMVEPRSASKELYAESLRNLLAISGRKATHLRDQATIQKALNSLFPPETLEETPKIHPYTE